MNSNYNLGGAKNILDETLFDVIFGDKWWIDASEEKGILIERVCAEVCEPALKALCNIFGHNIVEDMCGKLEHDYCVICNELFPGKASRRNK